MGPIATGCLSRRRAALTRKRYHKGEAANTPAKRIYLALQLMYTARDPRLDVHHSDA
jgi:hypothetical protein